MRKLFRSSLVAFIVLALIVGGGIASLKYWYSRSLGPVSSSTLTSDFTIENGMSVHDIAGDLKKAGLVRSAKAFETYVRSNELTNKLQAGTYELSPSMSTAQIVRKMVRGEVSKNLLTILPAKRLDEVKQAFKKAGYSDMDIDAAFSPANYIGHPALTSLPKGASLEGFLYPESFQKLAETPATTIVRESLDEMNQHLTPDIVAGFSAQGLNTYQGVTLASIVATETDDPASQPMVAQVFLTRLKKGMALGSDVTAFYASAIAGQQPSVTIDSPYNTRIHPGLPPGPISNVTASALNAVAHPANTNYLFFVAGDDKKIHFAQTQAQHEQNIKLYCTKSCAI